MEANVRKLHVGTQESFNLLLHWHGYQSDQSQCKQNGDDAIPSVKSDGDLKFTLVGVQKYISVNIGRHKPQRFTQPKHLFFFLFLPTPDWFGGFLWLFHFYSQKTTQTQVCHASTISHTKRLSVFVFIIIRKTVYVHLNKAASLSFRQYCF